jgi:hypothetical protein
MGSIIIAPPRGQDSATRAALIAHQSDLNADQAETVLADDNITDKQAFLPLIRREAAAPNYSPNALALLSEFSPTEARPLIIADVQEQHPHFRRHEYDIYAYPRCYLHLPDKPIPELTLYFHRELQKANQDSLDDLDALVELIDRYGTPDLLPEVLQFYRPYAGEWACRIETSCLRFWIRCDRQAGLAAFDASRRSRKTGCYRSLLEDVSEGRWDADMNRRALGDLRSDDPEIVATTLHFLSHHGNADDGEAIADAYLALVHKATVDPAAAKVVAQTWLPNPGSGARILLENKRLHFPVRQANALKALAARYP